MDRNLNIQKLLDETDLENGLSAGECKNLFQRQYGFVLLFQKNWCYRLTLKYGMNFNKNAHSVFRYF